MATKKSVPHETNSARSMQDFIIQMMLHIGDDPSREGLLETPDRVVRAWNEWFAGYHQDPADILKTFEDGAEQDVHKSGQIVLLTNIPVFSHCEHHIVPITGVAHVAYIPRKHIVGISKLDRLVACFARRLQVQERLTNQVVDALEEHLEPLGSACIITAKHLCMGTRGVNHPGVATTTSALRGAFKLNGDAREELMHLIKLGTAASI
jgi:GTP cyclohydrolase I